jgi:hypothetical protein
VADKVGLALAQRRCKVCQIERKKSKGLPQASIMLQDIVAVQMVPSRSMSDKNLAAVPIRNWQPQ